VDLHAALAEVRRWRFSPARIGSIRVKTEVEVPVRFELKWGAASGALALQSAGHTASGALAPGLDGRADGTAHFTGIRALMGRGIRANPQPSMHLASHRYGKSRVRVMKILRDGATHTIKELEVAVALEGDFATSYTAGDNSLVVATDTMKNTVHVLAHRHLGRETERFVQTLAGHFLEKYAQVQKATVTASERVWDRLSIGGAPHPHSFVNAQQARPFVTVTADRTTTAIESGIADLLILKSTGSGFSDFPRCEFTTLPETGDRIFATSLRATWHWSAAPADYSAANVAITTALLAPFAQNFSPSVQTTLYQMGEAALAACAEISRIQLAMPNKHCLLLDLKPFGIENKNEVFVPTDEPHGQIEATVGR
jgi:urate oxidase